MPRVMEKVVPVKIMTEEINCYATISRSCISATTACLRMKGIKGKHINDKLKMIREIKRWADNNYNACIDASSKQLD